MNKNKDSESDSAAVTDVDALVALQLERCEALKQILRNFKKDSAARKTKVYCQVRLEKVDFVHREFNKTHTTLICQDTNRESQYFTNKIASEFEECYFDTRVVLLEAYNEQMSLSADQASSSQQLISNKVSPVEIPKLPLPSFSGKYIEWTAFHDAFLRLIHTNQDLSAIQKFHFLKKALPVDSDVDVHQMALTETNYKTAWDLIVNRYNNPRLLFMHHMNKLFALPAVTTERSEDIKSLLNVANVCINEFNRLNTSATQTNQWIAYLLSTKLPKDTHQAWEYHLGSDTNIPTFEALEAFLNKRLVTINVIENRNLTFSTNVTSKSSGGADHAAPNKRLSRTTRLKQSSNSNSFHTTAQQKSGSSCYICGEAHILRRCPKFLAKDCFERKSIVDKAKLCLNCLSKAHTVSQCASTKNCLQCGQRHHTLLHFPPTKPCQQNESKPQPHEPTKSHTALNPSAPSFQGETLQSNTLNQHGSTSSKSTHSAQLLSKSSNDHSHLVLLATALVKLINDSTGQSIEIRALLDQGSECTLITEHAAQALGLRRNRASVEIFGVGSNAANRCKHTVSFAIQSLVNSNYKVTVDTAFVLKGITQSLPSQSIARQQWTHVSGLQLADPAYYLSRRIDLLLGADMFAQLLLPETRIGERNEPIAQRTQLGWILSGNTTITPKTNTASIYCNHVSLELESLVQRIFENDQVSNERSLTQEESWCEKHFQETHLRKPNGKYIVRLPLKTLFDGDKTIGKSKQIALNRFYSLERKLQRNHELRTRYEDGIREYFTLNQITPAITTEEQHHVKIGSNKPVVTTCVLPHHAVIKEDSLTTKFRIVFDASCKTSNGRSLNDILCVGPALQNELAAVILNWRKHKFAFTADIQKMYRCIDMDPNDSQYQRILWRNEENEIQEYCLTTVTFGTASAPFTAIRVLHQLAEDEKTSYPLATAVLRNEIYVDDVLSGSHSVETTIEIRTQLTLALRSAGMELRKWSSNSTVVLNGIPNEHRSDSNALELNGSDTVKTLGILWQPDIDVFKFKLNFDIDFTPTKRTMLSTIARLFDPLGLIAPIIVAAKIVLKSVWAFKMQRSDNNSTSLEWDETLPRSLNDQWQLFLKNLSQMPCLTVPRWLNYEPNLLKSLDLHVFCDGSMSAYAACVYLRVEYNDGRIYTTLLMAKTRVTPMKPLTIPRIELSGAVLATELGEWTKRSFSLPGASLPIYYWTDATIVLYWINGDPNRWQTWVSNRVGKILQTSSPSQWSHVDTLQNPADCATRGLTPACLSNFSLWWSGPEWLLLGKEKWPQLNVAEMRVSKEITEIKKKPLQINLTICQDSIILRFSSFTKTLRICAYVLRFMHNSRVQRQNRINGPLSVNELSQSLTKLVNLVQQESFHSEIHNVRNKMPLPHGSKLTNLTPFLDEQQVLRVRGRMQHSNLSFDRKHPIILPSKHHFTNLVITYAHLTTLHGGAQLTLTYLRQQFWILNARRTVQHQLRRCIKCFRNKPELASQLMGDLPFHRVNPPQRPFLATGIDYTGAIELKSSRFRGNTTYKGYIAVFICLATKCIHLEAVTSMSTEAFLMALQRFIGRRGLCKDIYSDCGTNFIGAEKVLQTKQPEFAEIVKKDIIPKLVSQGIQWHFNPPHSPNFGGLWEANVKSVKYHLKRVVSGARLTYEVLSTLLVRIEACLNSRPLCPLTSDPNELQVLTPGHFLIGDSLLSPPEASSSANIPLSQQFIQTQRMLNQFWKQWTTDWLSHLQTRPKWCHKRANLQINDLVIVKDERLPPNEWIMARVTHLHPGQDNLVRVVTIRTKNGTYKRSVSKLCLLPMPSFTQDK